ncbi:CrcB-like protein-domain-containing protein [Cristinia sonorae]|uniref:CrcB-like protein-domain-containing protein n=1 Tax=Cristinia sonorae TaxID=1940300 RepID=A0A8K0UNK8_9AGAR|nr:CrcB-like protein-domain-containing protein [Cristinia sonorae]
MTDVEKDVSSSGPSSHSPHDSDQPPLQRQVSNAESLASIDRPPSVDSITHCPLPASKVYHPFSPHVLALLFPASIFGVLARLGLQALVGYDGRAIFPLAWIQGAGCLVMGIGLGMKEPFGQFYGPLYTAMTTGFCGSLTTFSGWQVDVFESWLNVNRDHRDWFRDVIDGLSKTLFTLAISIAALQFGVHLTTMIRKRIPAFQLSPPSRSARNVLTSLAVLTYAAAYPAYFRLPASFRHQATAALLFCVPGTLTRYLLSIKLNPTLKLFPLGTFTANMFGTALLGTFHVLQSTHVPPSANGCAVLQGLGDGYCGCLTTVSTFAAEVVGLEDWRAWVYVVVSWVGGQSLLLAVVGGATWAGRVGKQATCLYE